MSSVDVLFVGHSSSEDQSGLLKQRDFQSVEVAEKTDIG